MPKSKKAAKKVSKKAPKKVSKKVTKKSPVKKKAKVKVQASPMLSLQVSSPLWNLLDEKAKRFTRWNRSQLVRFAVINFNPSQTDLKKLAGSKLLAA